MLANRSIEVEREKARAESLMQQLAETQQRLSETSSEVGVDGDTARLPHPTDFAVGRRNLPWVADMRLAIAAGQNGKLTELIEHKTMQLNAVVSQLQEERRVREKERSDTDRKSRHAAVCGSSRIPDNRLRDSCRLPRQTSSRVCQSSI